VTSVKCQGFGMVFVFAQAFVAFAFADGLSRDGVLFARAEVNG